MRWAREASPAPWSEQEGADAGEGGGMSLCCHCFKAGTMGSGGSVFQVLGTSPGRQPETVKSKKDAGLSLRSNLGM